MHPVSALIVQGVRRAIKADRSNRYRLKRPWSLYLLEPVPAPYRSWRLEFAGKKLIIMPHDDCDGATLAPDRIGSWSFVEAAIAHDSIYGEMEAIASAWGWTVDQVRAWADGLFLDVACEHAPSRIARWYWRGIRAAGGVWHRLGRIVAGLLLVTCIAGCSGCSTPVPVLDPNVPYEPPDYERIDR
jgi:hypothetical protein